MKCAATPTVLLQVWYFLEKKQPVPIAMRKNQYKAHLVINFHPQLCYLDAAVYSVLGTEEQQENQADCRHTKKQQQYRKWQFNSIWRKTNIKHFFLLSLHHVLLNYFLPSLLFTERDRRRVRDRKKISAIGNCSLSIGFFFFRSKIVKWISTLFRCVSFELSFNGKSFLPRNQFSIFFLHFDAMECLIIPKQLTKISLCIPCLFKCVYFLKIWKSFSINEAGKILQL
mgnify:CR=1 FL=1